MMQPFVQVYYPDEALDPKTYEAMGLDESEAKKLAQQMSEDKVWKNDVYQVAVRNLEGGLRHLSIKRIDREAVHDWRDFQWIKNRLCGDESEAVELYPAESRLVDSANQYHLWVFPEGHRVPIGFNERLVMTAAENEAMNATASMNAKQRPFEGEQP